MLLINPNVPLKIVCTKGKPNFDYFCTIYENEPYLEGNALFKARHIHNVTGMNVFADDTGLEIDALNGLPGVHSARFAGENKDSLANIQKKLTRKRAGLFLSGTHAFPVASCHSLSSV